MQIPLQTLVGAVKADLGRRYGNLQGRADLEVGPAINILHDHNRPHPRRKLAEGLAETLPELELIDPPFRSGTRVILGFGDFGEWRLRLSGVTPPGGRGGVDGDPIEPRRESGVASEGRQSPPGADPGFLGNVGRQVVIASEAKGERVDLASMALEQLCERQPIAQDGGRSKFGIIGEFDTRAAHVVTARPWWQRRSRYRQ